MTNIVQIKVPNTGMGAGNMQVIEVLVSVGDIVNEKQSCITIEGNKTSIEIPVPTSGRVKSVYTNVGDKVVEGSLILELEEQIISKSMLKNSSLDLKNSDATTAELNQDKFLEIPEKAEYQKDLKKNLDFYHPVHSSPTVRKFARELGVNLEQIVGSGPNKRITMSDVRLFVKNSLKNQEGVGRANNISLDLSDLPKVDFEEFGPIESKPISNVRTIIGNNLHRNWLSIPHVTNNDEADITDLEAFRISLNQEIKSKSANFKVTILAFLIKAISILLMKHPDFNSSINGKNLILKKYYNIGFAVDAPKGLVVPVIRDVDKKGILLIAEEIKIISNKARASKILSSELTGGCFSISSLGGIGGTSFTPIINFPEVAILGVSKAKYKPVWDKEKFIPRLMLPLSLSYDHRVIDGAYAARFNADLVEILSDYRKALL